MAPSSSSRTRSWGCAAAVLLIAHYDRRHLDTIRKLVAVWAPPNENDTEAYARHVAKASGFGIDEPLDLHDYGCLKPILTAMIRVENGRQPYTDAQIDAALVRAGVVPPQRSLQETRTVKGGQVAAAGTIGAGAIGAIQETVGQAHEALVGVVPYLDAAKWGLLAGITTPSVRRTRRSSASCRISMRRGGLPPPLIGIGVMLWARIDDRRKGLR